jgi:hypothetical protein
VNLKRHITLVLVIYLLVADVSAKKVLFYEIGGSQYNIEGQYSKYATSLRSRNFEVASIEKGELTKDKLENYDILVVQNLGKQLTTEEISAIIWFVLQKGRGLFINGGLESANQLSIPFGVTVDNGLLIDTTNQIPGVPDRNTFTIDRFIEHPGMVTLRQGVSKIGFYQGSGLVLSSNSNCIATGSSNTYSDTGSFAAGSAPCVIAASQFGNGLVVTVSDVDMLSDAHLDEFNNKNMGSNILDWLSVSTDESLQMNNTADLQLQIKEMKLQLARLNFTADQLGRDKASLFNQYGELSSQYAALQMEVQTTKEGMVGPFSRSNWAIVILGVCIMVAAIVYSQRRPSSGGGLKLKDEDILNELGYELDKPPGEGGAEKKSDALDDLKV